MLLCTDRFRSWSVISKSHINLPANWVDRKAGVGGSAVATSFSFSSVSVSSAHRFSAIIALLLWWSFTSIRLVKPVTERFNLFHTVFICFENKCGQQFTFIQLSPFSRHSRGRRRVASSLFGASFYTTVYYTSLHRKTSVYVKAAVGV